jgi:hypothetical protein
MNRAPSAVFLFAAPPFFTRRALQHNRFAMFPAPYPADALGVRLSAVVRAVAAATQAPVEIAAQAVLSVVSLAVQNRLSVQVPTGEIRPASCFFLTVAESGERKSAVAGLALAPVRAREGELARARPFEELDYHARLQAWRLTRARITRAALAEGSSGSGARGEGDAAIAEGKMLARKPLAPAPPFLVVSSCQVAGLIDQLKARPNLLLFSDAPAPLLRTAKLAGAAFLREVWDNGSFTAGRGRAAQRIVDRRLSIHLTAPPDEARAFLTDPALTREGVLARFLVAAPASRIGARAWCDPVLDPCLDDFERRIGAGLDAVAGPPADVAQVMTRVASFTPAAKDRWTAFAGEMERRMAAAGDFAAARALGAKLPQQAARLAALIAGYDNVPEIGEAAANGGIALARWYGAEALRLCAGPASAESAQCDDVLTWLRRVHPTGAFALSDLYREGPVFARSAGVARTVLRELEKGGHVRLAATWSRGGESWELTQKC